MTVAPLPSSPLLPTGTSTRPGAGATPSSGLGAQLPAELAQSDAANGTMSDAMLQSLVSLGSQNGAVAPSSASQTYTAQGLLAQIESTLASNPLLADTGSGIGSADSGGSPLAALLQGAGAGGSSLSTLAQDLAASGGAASAATGSTGATAGADPTASWAQLLRANPSLTARYVMSRADQGIIDTIA